jgi:hypothetical protein
MTRIAAQFAFWLAPGMALCQTVADRNIRTSTISGRVGDYSGAAVANAIVSLTPVGASEAGAKNEHRWAGRVRVI